MKNNKRDYYFIQLNLQKEKHKDLIEWIKNMAAKNEQSLSALCIKIIKDFAELDKQEQDG